MLSAEQISEVVKTGDAPPEGRSASLANVAKIMAVNSTCADSFSAARRRRPLPAQIAINK